MSVTLSAKTSLMLGVHKAGFRREGHFLKLFIIYFNLIYKIIIAVTRLQVPRQTNKMAMLPCRFEGSTPIIFHAARPQRVVKTCPKGQMSGHLYRLSGFQHIGF